MRGDGPVIGAERVGGEFAPVHEAAEREESGTEPDPVARSVGSAPDEAVRFALVIGNGKYQEATPLANPPNDAKAVAKQLNLAGWSVTELYDVGIKAMSDGILDFCDLARGAEAAIVFYAGHGIESRGENYILPVDAKLSEEDGAASLRREAIMVRQLLDDLGRARIRLKAVVLDSCRDDPLSRSWLSRTRGGKVLAEVAERDIPQGTMLIFSTAPGQTAADGVGENSPFTAALLNRMQTTTGGISDVFADAVKGMDGQEPWIAFDGSSASFIAFRDYPLFHNGADAGYADLMGKLGIALTSPVRSDLPKALSSALSTFSVSATDDVPDGVRARIELVCLRMVLEAPWSSELDRDLLRQASWEPIESSMAALVLANEELQAVDPLVREGRFEEANVHLKAGFEYLDRGISHDNPICRLKKGSVLTRHWHLNYGKSPELERPGSTEEGFELVEEAFSEFRDGTLKSQFFDPAGADFVVNDNYGLRESALVLAQCWLLGIGTGNPGALDGDGFDNRTAGEKAVSYFQQVLDLDPANGEALAGSLEILLHKNEGFWDPKMIGLAKAGAAAGNGFCEYYYATYLSEYDAADRSEVMTLMRKAAEPGKDKTSEARQWLKENR